MKTIEDLKADAFTDVELAERISGNTVTAMVQALEKEGYQITEEELVREIKMCSEGGAFVGGGTILITQILIV
ncbi:hypothetical protein [Intestinibacillus massiliensis]|uniref:hypothetical protein n=1 Tax=Intestinibacillus massiliensis TaxID=1871029 RepID=UPI000B3647C9|nr:hypothetical protein [Intestinibacillus massiliensis]